MEKQDSGVKEKAVVCCFEASVDFCDVNTPTVANFKLPLWCPLGHKIP